MKYFDNGATTRVRPQVAEEVNKYMLEDFANPSAMYSFGIKSERAIDRARQILADKLRVGPREIYFTPGGTWSNNMALIGTRTKGKILTTEIEHSSVYEVLKTRDRVEYVKVSEHGFVDLADLEAKLDSETALVSIIHVNNELGTVQNLEEIGRLVREKSSAILHVDGVQGFCKVEAYPKTWGVDIYTVSGHKIHAPKGIGAIYINKDLHLSPVFFGGSQEKGLFPGTENVPGIMGLAKSVEMMELEEGMVEIRDYIIDKALEIPGSRLNSPKENVSPYIINLGFTGIKSEILLNMLNDKGICLSAGSACSGSRISRVLQAVQVPDEYIDGSIRISLSHENTMEEASYLVEALEESVEFIRKIIGG